MDGVEPRTLEFRILLSFLEDRKPIKPGVLTRKLDISHSTLNSALIRMQNQNLLNWKKYGDVTLSEDGHRALEHIKHHNHLIKIFLIDSLNMEETEAHEESLRLAPHFSCRMIELLCRKYPRCEKHKDHNEF